MQLKKVIGYIQSKITDLNAKEKLSTQDKALLGVLDTVHALIEESQNGKHLEKIEEALLYLQRIPISRLFGKTPLNEILRQDGKVILPDQDKSYVINTSVSGAKILGSLHIGLMVYYQKFQHRVWHFAYENSDRAINNKVILAWQATQMEISKYTKRAYGDYMRDLAILNECGGSEEEVAARLGKLVASAHAYSPIDHALLFQWLEENGDQTNLAFILDSVVQHHFTDDGDDEDRLPMVAFSKNISGNWFVNENGEITLHYTFSVSALRYSDAVILTSNSGEIEKIENEFEMQAELERYKKLQEQGKELPPLLTFDIEIKLGFSNSLQDKKVVPQITLCHVSSFTDLLKSPARLFNPEDQLDSDSSYDPDSKPGDEKKKEHLL